MAESKQAFVSVRFQDFELDLHSGELRKTGAPAVRLPEQSFQILRMLLERSGKVVSRAEIQQCLWPDGTIVEFEHSIGAAMNRLRQVLGDSAENPRLIETLTRRGYRWMAGAEWVAESGPGSPAAPEGLVQHAPAEAPRSRSLLWWAVASSVTLALGLALAWHLYSRKERRLTEKDTIVIADFANSTGDPVFDDTLRQGLRVQLEQSPFLDVLSEQKVDEQLKLMMRPLGGSLTPELARDICQRAGSTAVVKGSISRLGTNYVLGLSAFNCHTGEELDDQQVEIASREQVLKALGAAAQNMRLKLGESLATVQKFDAPLEQATTPDLEALKAYSLGVSKWGKGDASGAIPLFQKAIELDPGFAAAYLELGRSYNILGKYGLAQEPIRKAYELRKRASERERFDIVAGYHQSVSFDLQQAMENCELWEQSYPREFAPHRILGFENGVLGRYERSAEEFAKARDLDPGQAIPYAGLMEDYMALNRLTEDEAVYEDARAHDVAAGLVEDKFYLLSFLRDDTPGMARVSAHLSSEPGFQITALREETNTAAYFGRLSEARQLTALMKEIALREKDTAVAADFLSDAAFREVLVGNTNEARRYAAEAVKLGGEPPTALMLSSDPAAATKMVAILESKSPPGGYMYKVRLPLIRGAIELNRGNSARALELFAPAEPYEAGYFDRYMPAYLRGEAYMVVHGGKEAAAEFQKIVSHRGVVLNDEIGAVAHVGLARACVIEGDKAKAKAAYQDFFTLWKNADPDIPILKQAKDEYAKLQ
ncbi:MAG: winged helix-turn-helix domain-containing protein [Candidatus Sulfotelmatobacter sp.]